MTLTQYGNNVLSPVCVRYVYPVTVFQYKSEVSCFVQFKIPTASENTSQVPFVTKFSIAPQAPFEFVYFVYRVHLINYSQLLPSACLFITSAALSGRKVPDNVRTQRNLCSARESTIFTRTSILAQTLLSVFGQEAKLKNGHH